MKFDVAVIGGGPGGYTAADHAAKKGLSVVLFEKDALGGTCLNRGCIPTKSLLHAAKVYHTLAEGTMYGVAAEHVSYSFSAMHVRKNEVIAKLRTGIEKQMKAGKVKVVYGAAQITGPGTVVCNQETYEAANVIIATGSQPSVPPIEGVELPGVYSSSDLLEREGNNFSSLILVGGGVIGTELASFYLTLGVPVTILEAADHILPPMDREIAQRLTMFLRKQGGKIVTKANVQRISQTDDGMQVAYLDKAGKECMVQAEGVLIATGRRAYLDGLFAEGAAPEMERGAVAADELGRTSIPGLYVIGDAKARNIQLAHVAEAQAKNVAAVIAGEAPVVDLSVIPSCIYTSPEIASVGMTEEEAKKTGIPVAVKKYLTGANGKCLIENAESGYVKLVTNAENGCILGAQLVCPRATDLIGELALAVQKGLTAADLAAVIHPHPTFSEMISGAAEL